MIPMPSPSSLVSVIIPTYNLAHYLPAAIDSVLGQGYGPLEVIVVDDGSTDATAAVVAAYGTQVSYVFQANSGIGAARNRGLDLARGQLIGFLDADDYWAQNKLTLQAPILEQNPAIGFVSGQVQQFVSPELSDERKAQLFCPQETMAGYVPSAALFRRELFEQVGRFEPAWALGEFMDWYLHAQEAGVRHVMLPDVVLYRRVHDSNTGLRKRDQRRDYVRVVHAAIQRRRSATRTAADFMSEVATDFVWQNDL